MDNVLSGRDKVCAFLLGTVSGRAGIALLAVAIFQIPAVKDRYGWRVDFAQAYLRGVIDPVKPLPAPKRAGQCRSGWAGPSCGRFYSGAQTVDCSDENRTSTLRRSNDPEVVGSLEMNTTPGAQVPATGMDFDQMFINMMVPHHQGAVEMAKIAQQRAEHTEIKQMADAIISGQQEEITQMKDWKKQWYGSNDTPPMSAMPMLEAMPGMGSASHTMNMQADVDQLKIAKEPFDLAFIDAMIPHHQSAIDAAQLVLKQATHPEIKQLAQTIIDAQQKEIDQMNSWRKAWYPDAAPVSITQP